MTIHPLVCVTTKAEFRSPTWAILGVAHIEAVAHWAIQGAAHVEVVAQWVIQGAPCVEVVAHWVIQGAAHVEKLFGENHQFSQNPYPLFTQFSWPQFLFYCQTVGTSVFRGSNQFSR